MDEGGEAATPTPRRQTLIALDLEGVLTPEIWPSVGRLLGISGLDRTTRDTGDYCALLRERLAVVAGAGVGFDELVAAVGRLEPLPGARQVLDGLRSRWPVVVLSDTFEQLAQPLLDMLGRPLMLCHRLDVRDGRIAAAELRQPDAKRRAVIALQQLGYRVVAAGDSHNDLDMLQAADAGCLVGPPSALRHLGLPVTEDLAQLARWIAAAADGPDAVAGHPDRSQRERR